MPYLEIFLLLTGVWLMGRIFKRLNWPEVFGEILAGVILGPVFLGLVQESEGIKILAELGIFFLMLHTGLETNPADLWKSSKLALVVALGGVILPLGLGYLVPRALGYTSEASLFIGMGLAITSIPVSARIFKEYGLSKSRISNVVLGAAIFDDIVGLIVFSVILAIMTEGKLSAAAVFLIIMKIVVLFLVVLFIGQRCFSKLHKVIYDGNKGFTFTIILALGFGLLAELMGIHMIVGAFLAGLFIREEVIEPKLFNKIEDRVYGLSYSFLGPIFFATLGFNLDLSILSHAGMATIIIIVVAIVSKVLGAGAAAFFLGMSRIESFSIGLAMNSRGSVELIVALIGLERGIIDQEIFSIMVLMAFVTTLISVVFLKPLARGLKRTIIK